MALWVGVLAHYATTCMKSAKSVICGDIKKVNQLNTYLGML